MALKRRARRDEELPRGPAVGCDRSALYGKSKATPHPSRHARDGFERLLLKR